MLQAALSAILLQPSHRFETLRRDGGITQAFFHGSLVILDERLSLAERGQADICIFGEFRRLSNARTEFARPM